MKYYIVTKKPGAKFSSSKGPFITLADDDEGLLEHEKFHVRQWWFWVIAFAIPAAFIPSYPEVGYSLSAIVVGFGAFMQTALYEMVRPYRQWSEVQAYKIQLKVGGITLDRAAEVLSKYYKLNISEEEARALLR